MGQLAGRGRGAERSPGRRPPGLPESLCQACRCPGFQGPELLLSPRRWTSQISLLLLPRTPPSPRSSAGRADVTSPCSPPPLGTDLQEAPALCPTSLLGLYGLEDVTVCLTCLTVLSGASCPSSPCSVTPALPWFPPAQKGNEEHFAPSQDCWEDPREGVGYAAVALGSGRGHTTSWSLPGQRLRKQTQIRAATPWAGENTCVQTLDLAILTLFV